MNIEELTRASSREAGEVGWVNVEAVGVAAEDGRGREAGAAGGNVGGTDSLRCALFVAENAQGDRVKALAEGRRSSIGTDGGGEENSDGSELHFE